MRWHQRRTLALHLPADQLQLPDHRERLQSLMRRSAIWLLALPLVPAMAAGDGLSAPSQDAVRVMTEDRLDSRHLEGELQSLDWEQFRSVVEAIPKLKADVDAYGPMGWEFVKERYKTHEWRKNIDKLNADEKRRLAALIDTATKRE